MGTLPLEVLARVIRIPAISARLLGTLAPSGAGSVVGGERLAGRSRRLVVRWRSPIGAAVVMCLTVHLLERIRSSARPPIQHLCHLGTDCAAMFLRLLLPSSVALELGGAWFLGQAWAGGRDVNALIDVVANGAKRSGP